jgi:hypothetical protein
MIVSHRQTPYMNVCASIYQRRIYVVQIKLQTPIEVIQARDAMVVHVGLQIFVLSSGEHGQRAVMLAWTISRHCGAAWSTQQILCPPALGTHHFRLPERPVQPVNGRVRVPRRRINPCRCNTSPALSHSVHCLFKYCSNPTNCHWVSPVTYSVHWVKCSFVSIHDRITIYISPPKILTLFCLFGTEILAVTVTDAKSVQFRGWCHASPEQLVGLLQYI